MHTSTLTQEQVLKAIEDLAKLDLDITHASIRNQLLSSGFRPTLADLQIESANTFVWLRQLSRILVVLRQLNKIEALGNGKGRKGTKYRLVSDPPKPAPPENPRQISLPLTECTSRDLLQSIAGDLADIKGLLRELCDRQSEPRVVMNANGKTVRSV